MLPSQVITPNPETTSENETLTCLRAKITGIR